MPLTKKILKDKNDPLERKRKLEEQDPNTGTNTDSSDGLTTDEPTSDSLSSESELESEKQSDSKAQETRFGRKIKPPQKLEGYTLFSPQKESSFNLIDYRFLGSPGVRACVDESSGMNTALVDSLRKLDGFRSPSQMTVIVSGDHSSPFIISTPSGKEYQRIFKCKVTQSSSDSGALQFFQERREITTPSLRKTQLVPENMTIPRPSKSEEVIQEVLISPGAIERNRKRPRIDPRKKFDGLNAQTIAFIFDDNSLNTTQEYSHTRAHCHGGDDVVVASQHHNSLRIVTIEYYGTKIILEGEPLYYSDFVEYDQDENGPTPVAKKEIAAWENKKGDRIEVMFDPKLSIKPSAKLFQLMDGVYQLIFGASSDDSQHVASHETLFGI